MIGLRSCNGFNWQSWDSLTYSVTQQTPSPCSMQGLCQMSWGCPALQELTDMEHEEGKQCQRANLKDVRLAEGTRAVNMNNRHEDVKPCGRRGNGRLENLMQCKVSPQEQEHRSWRSRTASHGGTSVWPSTGCSGYCRNKEKNYAGGCGHSPTIYYIYYIYYLFLCMHELIYSSPQPNKMGIILPLVFRSRH